MILPIFEKVKELGTTTMITRICVDVSNISPTFNPDEFKAQQRQMWNNCCPGWQTWWETIERGAQKVSDKIVELVKSKLGDKVLDIATGIGEPAVTATEKLCQMAKLLLLTFLLKC